MTRPPSTQEKNQSVRNLGTSASSDNDAVKAPTMAIQKKHGKARLDKWYKLAKEKGFRARAAFKLIQLNKKHGFLEKSKVLLDLCAAPGSWCQVAAQTMPAGSLIVGVDLAPIKAMPKVITFQSDISSDKCRATIRGYLKTWKADTVLHDGAPNMGTAWVHDSYNQAELVLHSLKLATDFLIGGGTFVTKVFRSKDYNPLMWVFNQLFAKVEATKPPSSRNVSAEIFVVCQGFKAPKRIDPRLLDPRAVFEELAGPASNNEAKVYNPTAKKRRRDGYEDGDYTQFKEISASEFIQTMDPVAVLGQYNRLTFEQPKNGDVALAALDKLPETTSEMREYCQDLKVLGRRDFKQLLKWRLKVRDIFGLPGKKPAKTEEVVHVEEMDQELKIQDELQRLQDKESAKRKKERRKENQQKQKQIVRMQMNMMAPMDIAMEQEGPMGDEATFCLKTIDQTSALHRIAKGKMAMLKEDEGKKNRDSCIGSSADTDDDSDPEENRLEQALDEMYEHYKERKAAADAKYRAKKARQEHSDEEWEGVSRSEHGDSDGLQLEEDSSQDEADGSEGETVSQTLLRDLTKKKAKLGYFNQDVFQSFPGLLDLPKDEDEHETGADSEDELPSMAEQKRIIETNTTSQEGQTAAIEFLKGQGKDDDDWDEKDKRQKDEGPRIDIITAEAMTLAHQLATGQKTTHTVIDDGFNKYSFQDRAGLPDWFLDDEAEHSKLNRPITKAAAAAIKEKMRALNARPIKKVREAQARKKLKAAQRLEKLKKKGEELVQAESLTERDKADQIAKMMRRAGKKAPRRPVTIVKATGFNKGQGRPRGVKGRYKMVDPRMKKEMRAMKRIAKVKK